MAKRKKDSGSSLGGIATLMGWIMGIIIVGWLRM